MDPRTLLLPLLAAALLSLPLAGAAPASSSDCVYQGGIDVEVTLSECLKPVSSVVGPAACLADPPHLMFCLGILD